MHFDCQECELILGDNVLKQLKELKGKIKYNENTIKKLKKLRKLRRK